MKNYKKIEDVRKLTTSGKNFRILESGGDSITILQTKMNKVLKWHDVYYNDNETLIRILLDANNNELADWTDFRDCEDGDEDGDWENGFYNINAFDLIFSSLSESDLRKINYDDYNKNEYNLYVFKIDYKQVGFLVTLKNYGEILLKKTYYLNNEINENNNDVDYAIVSLRYTRSGTPIKIVNSGYSKIDINPYGSTAEQYLESQIVLVNAKKINRITLPSEIHKVDSINEVIVYSDTIIF